MTDLSMQEPGGFSDIEDRPLEPRPVVVPFSRPVPGGETGGFVPEKDKVFDPARAEENLQRRLALASEAAAREVFSLDANKAQKSARLARKYGLDPSVVTPELTEFEIKDLAERFNAAPPKTKLFLGSDAINAALGYQDVEVIGAVERGLQNVFEVPKGVPRGAGSLFGGAMQGAGVNAAAFTRDQIAVMDRIDAGEKVPETDDPMGYQHMGAEDRAEARRTVQAQAAVPLRSLPLVKAGEALPGQFDIFPARKGFEDSVGRQLGEAGGSLVAGVAMSALTGPVASGAVFTLSGSGEAVQRAIDGGATDEQIIAAARLGAIPGMTDALPIETLLGRIPIPGGRILKVPAGMLGPALKGVGRIGWQAFIEGAQEGGQTFLQNLIAQEVYKPDQRLTEGLPGDAAIGGGVGAMAQTAKEGAGLLFGRRRGGHFQAAKDFQDQQRAADLAKGKAETVADAMQKVQSLKLTEADPERVKSLLGQIAGTDANVYLPGAELTRLYQDGIVTDQTLSDWGVLDQMMEVRATGGDLVIPAANFLTSKVAENAIAEVTKSVRLSPSAMTANEAEAFQADRQARVTDFLERMAIEAENRPDGAFVYDSVYDALVAAGTAAKDAEAYAALTAQRYQRRAADSAGLTADALFVRDRFKITGPGMDEGTRKAVKDELDVVIARLQSGRETKTPKTPVLDILRARGGVDPNSPLGTDLAALGLTARSNPGLFKASGLKAADNIVASEERVLADNGIAVDPNGYAQPDALMAAIREEIAGRPWQTQAEKDRIETLDAPVAELRKIMDKAGFDYRTASPSAIRAFLETQITSEPVLPGKVETDLSQGGVDLSPGGGAKQFRLAHTTIDYGISRDGTTAEIILVKTPRPERGAGSARAALEAILRAFDSAGLTTFLTADPIEKGVSKAKLTSFYKSLGFVENAGRQKDFRSRAGMIRHPHELDQPDGSGGMKRGSFVRRRDPYGDILNIINLTRNADRSTFLHESGHFWYHQLVEDAFAPDVRPEARDRLQADLQATLKWFGLDIDVKSSSPEAIFAATTREHHEQFARGAEAYFMEGRAPSIEARRLFAKFSGWLISIYKKLRALNVDLTPEVRGVFDRLLATEEAIEEARANRIYSVPAEMAETLTAAEKADIERLAEQAVIEARIEMQGKVAREIQREKSDAWKKDKQALTEELTLAVRRRPVYAALNLMHDAENAGGEKVVNEDGSPRSFKLNRKEMTDRYGEEIVGLLPSGIWARNGSPAVSVDLMASLAGFDSADSLKVALMNAKDAPERDVIRTEVEAELKRRHGDIVADAADLAVEAVANDKQLELMALQARHIRRLAGEKMRQAATRQGIRDGAAPLDEARDAVKATSADVDAIERVGAPAEAAVGAQVVEEMARATQSAQSPQRAAQNAAVALVRKLPPVSYDVEIIKEAAAEFVRGKPVKLLGAPERYEVQGQRLTREIEKAIAGRDYTTAQNLMEQRLFNVQIAREVRKAGREIEKARTYLDKFDEKKTRQAIGKAGEGYLEQIDGLLEAYEFRRATDAFLNRKQILSDWLRGQEASGNVVPVVPESVMSRLATINYREVPFGELMDLKDAVKSIHHVAREKNKLMRETEKRELNALVDEGIASIAASIPPLPPNINPQRDDFGSKWNAGLVGAGGLLKKARTYFVAMDGKEAGGFFDQTILAPIRNAEVSLLKRKDQEGAKFQALLKRHYGKGAPKLASKSSSVFVERINASLTLEERLSVALNWGNDGNRQAMLDDKARNWSQADIEAILDTLEKRDWDFVQATWDYIDSFWPEIAALQKKRTGLAPEKVERAAVQTRFGDYKGGYYPLKYDGDLSSRTGENDINQEFEAMNAGRFAAASTRRGHTKERTSSGKQSPMLSLTVIPRHVNQVLTDLELGPAISDAWKIVNHPRMKEAIDGHLGTNVNRQLDVWIKDVAAGQIVAGDAFSKTLRGLRTSVSVGAMGWKVTTTALQVTGFSQSFVRVGYGPMVRGIAKFLANPVGMARQIHAQSDFMEMRARTFQRDVADALSQARGIGGFKGKALSAMFYPMAKMQQFVDMPTWLAGYERAVKEGKSGDDAIHFADSMVEAAQSSSLMSNLSPVERGTLTQSVRNAEVVKAFTIFYSYFNTKLNLAIQRTQATDFRRPGQVAELAGDYLMLFWFEAAMTEAIRNIPKAFDDEDEEERTWGEGMAHQLWLVMQNLAGMVPLLRDVAGAAEGFDAGPGGSRALGDLGAAAAQTYKAAKAVAEEEEVNEWSLIRSFITAGNVVSPIKYPSGQINIAVKGLEKQSEGDDVSLIDFLMAKPK